MASLHHAAAPSALDHRLFSSPNPFLRPEPAPVALGPIDQNAPPAESLEVTVLWGTSVLAVAQLTPPRPYAVGEVGGAGGAGTSAAGSVDFALSAERLGSERRQLVALRQGAPFAVFNGDATPRVLEHGRAVDAEAAIVDCSEIELGARGIELRQGRVVIIDASGVTFRLAGSEKPARVPRALLGATDRPAIATLGSAALLQGLLIASLAYFTPSMAWGADDELDRDRLVLMQQYLNAQAEREHQLEQEASDKGGEQGAPAAASPGPEGKSGRENAPQQQRRMAIAGSTAERLVGRAELVKEASTFGTIGLLSALNANSAPSSPWGAELATGPDAENGQGDLWGDQIGDVAGHGLGVSGTERGAGGPGTGIGVGRIGTCSGLNCYGNGNEGGFARSAALGSIGHVTKGPRIAASPPTLSGRLPPDVIQRIVRQNFGRFRQCYEIGLQTNPNLAGRVTARFVIGSEGAVSNVSIAGSDLPDPKVASCVASSFYGLSFPAPEAGIVTVSYPILLTPG
jgi:hypothetical protein